MFKKEKNELIYTDFLGHSYSSDLVRLVNEDGNKYILKIWKDIEKGKESLSKQVNFRHMSISDYAVKTPKIIQTEILEDGRFSAKMKYIEGDCGVDIIKRSSRQTVLRLREVLGSLLYLNFEVANVKDISVNIFIDKLLSVKAQTNYSKISQLIDELIRRISLRKEINMPIGPCHGDLTFSNLILSGSDSMYLIDFLPSFIESPVWDLVKLEQDLQMGWSYRYMEGANKATAKIVFNSCIPTQFKQMKSFWDYQTKILSAINLTRIAPYIKDDLTYQWLLFNLEIAINNIN